MHYSETPENFRLATQAFAEDVITNAKAYLLNVGAQMPSEWNIVDCLVVGSLGVDVDNAYGSFPSNQSEWGLIGDIDLRFISTGMETDVTIPENPKLRNRLFHYFKFYLPQIYYANFGYIPVPVQLDVGVITWHQIKSRAELVGLPQSEHTGFSLISGKYYADKDDYFNNSGFNFY